MEFAAKSIVLPVLGLALMLAGLPVGWPLPGMEFAESPSFASGIAHFADSLVRFARSCAVFADSLVRIAFRGLWERSPRTSKTVPGLAEV